MSFLNRPTYSADPEFPPRVDSSAGSEPIVRTEYLSSKEASRLSGYTTRYLTKIASERSVLARQEPGGEWLIERGSLERFIVAKQAENAARHEAMRKERAAEYLRNAKRGFSWKWLIPATSLAAVMIFTMTLYGGQSGFSALYSSGASFEQSGASLLSGFLDMFGGIFSGSHPPATISAFVPTTTSKQGTTSPINVGTINNYNTYNTYNTTNHYAAPAQTGAQNSGGGISEKTFNATLESFKNSILSQIYAVSAAQSSSIIGNTQAIQLMNAPNNNYESVHIIRSSFSNGTISNATINNATYTGGSATFDAFSVSGDSIFGNLTAATTTLTGPLTVSSAATSTFASGITLSGGCFSVNGVCVGANNGTVIASNQGYMPYYSATGDTVTGTSTIFVSTAGNIGIGTTTPGSALTLSGDASVTGNLTVTSTTTANHFTFSDATGTALSVAQLTLNNALGVAYGGTGSNTFAYGLVLSPGGTNAFTNIATSSLGLLTTDVLEGTNLYYKDSRVNSYIDASTTIPKTYTANAFTALQTFGNASTTLLSSAYASSTNAFFGNLSITGFSSSGLGIDVNGRVYGAATTSAGTGLSYSAGSFNNTGVLSAKQTYGSALTGALTFATSTLALNGQTHGIQITDNGSNTFTLTPTLSGTLGVVGGGTGLSSIASSSLLIGGPGNTMIGYATSSLGIALSDTVGTLSALRGGTGLASYNTGDVIYADAPNHLSALAVGSSGQVLKVTGGIPAWGLDQTVGSGGAAGTWSTTTSQVPGRLINYSNNNSDIVTIGGTATTSAPFWFDPNALIGYFSGKVGIGTTTPAAPLSVQATAVGSTREALFKGTVSDGSNDAFYISNGTSADGRFNPAFSGYVDTTNNNYSLDFRGMTSSAQDASDSSTKGLINFETYITNSPTDPNNGTLSAVSNRKLLTLYNGSTTNVFTVMASGNVGIGTSSPQAKVDIYGGSLNLGYGYGISVGAGTNSSWPSGTTNLITTGWNGSYDFVSYYTPGSMRPTPVETMLASGNVGIGTTSPYSLLSVQATAGGSTPLFAVASSTNGVGTSTAFTVLGNGNVGIGTSSPYTQFAIDNGGFVPKAFSVAPLGVISGNTNTINGIEMRNVNTGNTAEFRFAVSAASTTASDTDASYLAFDAPGPGNTATLFGQTRSSLLTIFTNGSTAGRNLAIGTVASNDFIFGTANTERMRITSGGNVGIGSTTPGTILSLGDTGANTVNISTTATSTFGSGINVRTGCFSVNGTCLGLSSLAGTVPVANGGTGVTSFTANSLLYSNGAGTALAYAATTSANTALAIVARDASGNFSAGTITAALTGNASTATTLQTTRAINGTNFNGSADITVTAAAGTLTGSTLNSGVTASSLTSVGTITSGTWSGSFGAVSGANLTNLTAANISAGTAGINISGNAATVTTNANLTGNVTSVGNATTIAAGVVTNAMLAGSIASSKLVGSDIATVGTITSGVWNAGAVTSSGTVTGSSFSGAGTGLTGTASSLTVGASRLVTSPDGGRDAGAILPTTNTNAVRYDFVGAGTTGTGGNYAGVMTYAPWTGTTASTGDASYQLAFGSTATNGGGIPQLNIRKGIDSSWNSWYTILHAGNYNNYSPTLTGTGASGTWGIGISGNASTATTLQTTRAINGTNFNGSADITVTAAAGTLTGSTLNSGVTASSLTSVGTITSGTWSGSFGAVSGANLTNVNAAQLNGLSSTQLFNNMGNNHGTFTSFSGPTTFGNFFVHQDGGVTDGPGSAVQYYSNSVGLGNDYAYSSYAMQTAIQRNTTNPYEYIRYREGGSWGSWTKLAAGTADTAGTVTTAAQPAITSVGTLTSLTSSGTVTGSSFSGAGTGLTGTASSLSIGGNAATVTGMTNASGGCTDLNSLTTSGFYRTNACNANDPGAYGQLLTIHGASDTITQIYGQYSTGSLFTRSGNPSDVGGAGAWTSWHTVLDSANYNAYAPTLTGTGASGNWAVNAAGLYGTPNVTVGTIASGAINSQTISSAANFTGSVTASSGTITGNVLRSNTNVYTDQNYGYGLVGVYSATKYQGVFAMGDSYKLAADGSSPGSLYGIAWTHQNIGGESKSGLEHQALFMKNGVTQTAIGTGIWTMGVITGTSNMAISGTVTGGTYNGQTISSAASFTGTLTTAGLINATNYLQVNSKYAIDGTDSYLRLNQQGSFSSGTYTPYVFRADGAMYADGGLGNNTGATLSITGGTSGYTNFSGGNVGIGAASPDTKLEVRGSSLNSDASGYVNHYTDVAHTYLGGGTQTGTLKIALPVAWSNTMMSVTIKGYDYTSNGAWEVTVGGYNYSGPYWVNTSATITGRAPFSSVRLAYDGSKTVILLGNTSTQWNYASVDVTDVMAGYNAITGFGSGWAMSLLSSESGISLVNTPAIDMNVNSSGNVLIGGGTGKLTVGTVDPVYSIDGTNYATYVSGMVGQKEEVTGTADISTAMAAPDGSQGYGSVIDFDNTTPGSDLWLFAHATDITKNIGNVVVLLTPEGGGKAWYTVDKANRKIYLLSDTPTQVSYRLTAPRFDADTWTNYNHDNVTGLLPPSDSTNYFATSTFALGFNSPLFELKNNLSLLGIGTEVQQSTTTPPAISIDASGNVVINGKVQLPGYGAGTVTVDANGNITVATSTDATTSPAALIAGTWSDASDTLKSLISGLGDIVVRVYEGSVYAVNGLFDNVFAKTVSADKVQAQQLCVGNVCITQAQFLAMVNAAGNGQGSGTASSIPSSAQNTESGIVNGGTASSTPSSGSSQNGESGIVNGGSVADTTAPTITLNGDSPATIAVGSTYADLGATVTDNVDQNLGYKVSVDGGALIDPSGITLDTSTSSTHVILYSATDTAGNTGTARRTVVVE